MKRPGLILGLIGVVGISSATLVWRARSEAKKSATGKALFTGGVALSARMPGHDVDLPPETVRCANCHGRQPPPVASAAAGSGKPQDVYGSALSAEALLQSRPRRGGPPSRYDLAAFCRVLSHGIDPAHVMVTQTMPRYRVSPEQCDSLWSFVTAE